MALVPGLGAVPVCSLSRAHFLSIGRRPGVQGFAVLLAMCVLFSFTSCTS